MNSRSLGKSGISVSPIGLGCWAIGGPFTSGGLAAGWGNVDDAQSERAIAAGLEQGVTLFDTADVYGIGRSERVLGRALGRRRPDVVIATKFGNTYDEAAKNMVGTNIAPDYIRQALAASLARLGTDYVDLYQLHVGDAEPGPMARVAETLESLASEGKIRAWGWSTDDAPRVAALGDYPHFVAVQQELNVLHGSADLLAVAERRGLASLNRSPLGMGLLTGKFAAGSKLPAADVRSAGHVWLRDFHEGVPDPTALARLAALRDLLTTSGRTLAQGALCWLLARSPVTLPIPGFKSEAQAVENAGAIAKGPLPAAVMAEIEAVLAADIEPAEA